MDPRIPRTQSQSNVSQAVCLEFLNWKVSTGSSRAHAHAHSFNARWRPPPTYQDSCSIPIHPSNDRSLIDIPHSMHFHANTGFPLGLRVRPSCPRKLDRFRSAHNPPTKHVLERENVPRGLTVLHVAHVTLGTYRLVGGCARVSGCARPTARDPSRRTNEARKARDTVGIV